MLLDHGLEDAAQLGPLLGRRQADGVGGEAEPTHELAGSHLKQLHSGHPLIRRQGEHITADGAVAEAHLLIGGEGVDALQLIAHAGGTLEIKPLGVALHLPMEQLEQFLIAPLEHHRHLAQGVVIGLGADLLLTDARAAADVVVQTGAVLVQRLGPLPQGEHPLHQ